MEVWIDEPKPKVFGAKNVALAIVLHILLFSVFYAFAKLHFRPKETVIPIDLTVVVNENVDGEENEPPPLDQTKPEPPPPPPPPKEVEPPKVVEKVEAVEVVKEKPKETKKPPEKKPPEKSAKELREERMRRMREKATTVKTPIVVKNQPSGNGKTAKKTLSDREIQDLLNKGYKPGKKEELATSELQRCISLIQMALDRKWNELNPTIDRSGVVYLSVQFSTAGRLVNCRVKTSCGSAVSDRAALTVANSVGVIVGLDPAFIAQSQREPMTIRYTIRGQ